MVDLVETEWDPAGRTFVPRRRLDVLSQVLPVLIERFTSHRAFSEVSVTDVLGPLQSRARKLEVTTLASMIFFNRGDRFESEPLPREAQEAPAFGVNVADFDGDGFEDVFLSQNFFAVAGESSRLDAGQGLILRGLGNGKLEPMSAVQSGIAVHGEQRGAATGDFDADGRPDLVVSQNGAATKLFRNTGAKPGLRVRLVCADGNPAGVGAMLRLKYGERLGPAREVHGGSGYWSQDDSTQVLGSSGVPTHVWVRWPGGTLDTVLVPSGEIEVVVTRPKSAKLR